MKNLLFFSPLLRKVQDGSLFNSICGWIVRILGFALLIPLIMFSISIWSTLSHGEPPAEIIIFVIIAQLIAIVLSYLLFNLLWIRGSDILGLKRDPDYSATPIIVTLMKTAFESGTFLLIAVSTLMTFAIWLAPGYMGMVSQLSPLVPPIAGGISSSSFLDGMIVLIVGPVGSFLFLLVGYYLSEIVGALVAVAINTTKKTKA